ncbi:FMN-binding protein [Mycoplasmatota bacterium]|nr:FMN-binding protein [Mycoplasmatota bacterium]
MKHVKIISSLLVVVVICMVAIFLIEGPTSKIINERLMQEANAALFEIYPDATGFEEVTEEYPTDEAILNIFTVKEGETQVGVVYKGEVAGYNPGVQFLLGVTTDDEVAGFKILANSETAGIGKDLIEHPDFAEQFAGVPRETMQDVGVDLVAGSTANVTLGGVNKGVKHVLTYHGVNFKGEVAVVPETEEEKIERLKSEFFPGSTFTDVTGDYPEGDIILEILEASNGGYIFTTLFNGYSLDSVYMIGIGTDGVVTGYSTLSTKETAGIGEALVMNEEFQAQFAGISVEQLKETGVDSVAGTSAPFTLEGLNESLSELASYFNKEVLGVQDTVAPELAILPKQTEFEVGSTAPVWDSYVTATDNEDGVVVTHDAEAVVDMNVAGTYTVMYTATDTAGNYTTLTIEFVISEGAVEIVLVPVSDEVEAILATMDPEASEYSDELISDEIIKGIYTSRDADKNITSVFYDVETENGGYASNNKIMVQFDPSINSITKVNVYVSKATYKTDSYAPNSGKGEDLDSPLIAAVWEGVAQVGQVTEADVDSVSGTTAVETFPSLIEVIDYVINYQVTNQIGGAE